MAGKGPRGFTLVEIVLVITILTVVVPIVVIGLQTMVVQSVKAEKITVATDLARYYMELALSKRFDEYSPGLGDAEPIDWTLAGNLGTETGAANVDGDDNENTDMPNHFDDVDDFDILNDFPIPGFPEYTLTMTVQYWTVTGSGVNEGVWGTTPSGTRTNAKRVQVVVNHGLIGEVTLNAVTGGLYYQQKIGAWH